MSIVLSALCTFAGAGHMHFYLTDTFAISQETVPINTV